MVTEKYIFYPAWIRTVGPGLALASLLSALIVVAASHGLVSTGLALGLLVVPNLILVGFYARWLIRGCIVVKPNQVILRGYMHVIDKDGHRRKAYIKQYVPRTEWRSISVEGLFFPAVTWNRYGETFVFGYVSRPHLLRKLLATPHAAFDKTLTLSPPLMFFIGSTKRLGAAVSAGTEAVARLFPGTRPHLTAITRWALHAARRAVYAIGKRLVTLSGGSRPPAVEYARFVAFCQRYLLDRRAADAKSERISFYMQTLEQACIVLPWTAGPQADDYFPWVLHPAIHSVDDITQRIPQRTFEQRWFENVLAEIDWGDAAAGKKINANFKPDMTIPEYIDLQAKTYRTETYDGEAVSSRLSKRQPKGNTANPP